MFTVIFLSKSAKAIFDKSKTFFDPFRERGDIAFCEWNESDRALTSLQALPQLKEIIRGKSAWRAVVVDHATPDHHDHARDPENPFDFVDNTRSQLALTDSPHALVRIAHQLLGYPALTAREFIPIVSYLESDGTRVESAEGDNYHEVLSALGRTKSDVRVEFREQPYTEEEMRRHAELRERYRMKEVHPDEVIFISTRSRLDADEAAALHRAWLTETEQHASRFVERNDYPAATRFAVYDLLNPENSGYEQDELRFWLSVLTVAVNALPPSSFQAERVYELGVEFSEPLLGDLLNQHMSRLASLREHLDGLISRPERPPETDVAELLREEVIRVDFESIGGADIAVSTGGYGLASDSPRSESARWAADFDHVQVNATQFVRRPRRVLARAVDTARESSRRYFHDVHVLTDIDRDEIEDELSKRVRSLTEPATAEILDRQRLTTMLEEQNATVRRHISERMSLRTIGVASVLVIAVWFGALTPYMLQAFGRNAEVATWSVFVVATVIVLLAMAGLAALWWMRRRLIALLRDVNRTLRAFVAGVNNGATAFGQYLSGLTTYMHARATLINSGRIQELERLRKRRYLAVRRDVVSAFDAEKRIMTSLGEPLNVRRVASGLAQFDVDDQRELASFFRFPTGNRNAAFNDSGEHVLAPYDFITRLRLERVRLFEHDHLAPDPAEQM
ncbi:hypothetical protein ACFQZV_05360 [Microbacterium koreense]|uniref:Uncharacterized protein n=1 Tax=Microbacterium koreense TaxID=323761 RepID=A0ABW2ZQ22_9MICO